MAGSRASALFGAAARGLTRHPLLVIGTWLLLALVGNLTVAQLERVVHDHSGSFFPADAPSGVAATRMGQLFGDADSNNAIYLVLESDHALGAPESQYYAQLVERLRADTAHVRSVLDLWSQPAASAVVVQSQDHRAVSVMLQLAGQLGSTSANHAVAAVHDIVAHTPKPDGLSVYVTGPGATIVDEFALIDRQMLVITGLSTALIAVLLLIVYRSIVTAAIPLAAVGICLAVARPIVAALGQHGIIEVSVFSVALMAAMVLGAGIDYAIFLIARYHENRRAGVELPNALVGAYRGVGPVIVASALTIAVALTCLVSTNIGMLRSAGIPCAIGILTAMAASVTLLPAMIALAGRRRLLEPRPTSTARRWRRIGTTVARWPGPVLAASAAALLLCMLPVFGLRLGFSEIHAQPTDTESNRGYTAMDRHFPADTLLPEVVVVNADHDLRNPAGLIAIERVSRQIMTVRGCAQCSPVAVRRGCLRRMRPWPARFG